MDGFKKIAPAAPSVLLTASQAQSGPPISPLVRITTYSPAEWEAFIEEWVAYDLEKKYAQVLRFSGSNDRGIDVAGFADADMLLGVWDNYQCKHYTKPIAPSDAWVEVGKILWHSFSGQYKPPRAYFFVAPKGTGTQLTHLLGNASKLRERLIAEWEKNVQSEITTTQEVKLEGKFKQHVESFDFTIFKTISPRDIVEQHRSSPYFISRFGGGLPPRPAVGQTPEEIDEAKEGAYVRHLLDAYADHSKEAIADASELKKWKPLQEHFIRQRECFYHAESLRVFVRDKVEPGTFEGLQDEIFHGVVDLCEGTHADGFECVKAVTQAAQTISLDAHPLGQSAFPRDRRGICHQLANEDRLKWTK